jgi:hypothetical protein
MPGACEEEEAAFVEALGGAIAAAPMGVVSGALPAVGFS